MEADLIGEDGCRLRRSRWALVVHGGAVQMRPGDLSPAEEALHRQGLRAALVAGSAILQTGGASLDAVEAAVCVLEDDPLFNAGRGAVFTADGRNELDASIMEGRTLSAGSVSGVTSARNPVRLARAVLEHSPHVMLTGAGAEAFAETVEGERVPPAHFRTQRRWDQLQEALSLGGAFDAALKYGTVGAVALDLHANLAAATSTGGLTAKRWGRVGDTPVIGAGTYADNRSCAASATGSGEHFLTAAATHQIACRVRFGGMSTPAAAKAVIDEIGSSAGVGGVIYVDADGEAGWAFNTTGMFRGKCGSDAEETVAIYGEADE